MAKEDKKVFVHILESLLFSSEDPLTIPRIRDIIPELKPKEISDAVNLLNTQYQKSGRTFEIKEIAGGYQFFTLPEYADYVEKLFQSKQASRLTQKALETLAIVAYKQPLTKHEIEEIRGVNVDGVMKTLLSRSLVTISGRAKAPGSPFLYMTTRKFLDYFGLNSLEDLPKLKEIDELIDVEDEHSPHHETIFREINLGELGLRSNGNGEDEKAERNGTEENPAQ
ncbi:MAG: SMC-Scp complex subunit ScpB [bacterium]|nr:MAG: SMC-Scp complex subunit ScpB [bacterium]